MSLVMSHVSRQMSHVTCHMSLFCLSFFEQSCEAYRWSVCYQRGLPRLVHTQYDIRRQKKKHLSNRVRVYIYYKKVGKSGTFNLN